MQQNPNRVVAPITLEPQVYQSEVAQPSNGSIQAGMQQTPNHIDAQITIAKDAYQLAKELDPGIGTREEWIASLQGQDTWTRLINEWAAEPTLLTTIAEGEVYEYVYAALTYYRLVPAPYDSAADAFYSTFTSGVLTGKITSRSQP